MRAAGGTAAAALRALADGARAFPRQRSGATALMFGVTLPVVALAAGMAVDHGRQVGARSGLQAAADAAALAAAGELRLAGADDARIVAVARAYAAARLGDDPSVKVDAAVSGDRAVVDVVVTRALTSAFGAITGRDLPVAGRASARLSGRLPICVIALDGSGKEVLSLDKNAVLSANGCGVYSNSRDKEGLVVDKAAVLSTGLTCTSGGWTGKGRPTPTPLTDCPPMPDPLSSRPQPSPGPCVGTPKKITSSRRLSPGTYCGGLEVGKGGSLTLDPGVYVMKDGALTVRDGGRLDGVGVGIHFVGADAVIRFDFESHVRLEAPVSGVMAGLLFTEERALSPLQASIEAPLAPKGGRTHFITSDDAGTLLGTIYLPRSTLRVDANKPVAQTSAYTVLVVLRLDVDAGPNLVLNSNYAGTSVPVPPGLGPNGSKVVLER